ncbi:hypothetical protein CVS40_11677 [Lucilia cuprina]|nr:hypothetical protein CVS40_11677 [Lucilia cuprina]
MHVVAAGVGHAPTMQGCSNICRYLANIQNKQPKVSALAIWRYNDNKQKKKRNSVPKVELYDSPDVDAWTRDFSKAGGTKY